MKNKESSKEFPRVWIRDINSRKYREGPDGRTYGSPIEFYHWKELEIIGETSRSWITERNRKIPKKGSTACFSIEEVHERVFVTENAYKISSKVRECGYAKLKEIADLIGYESKTNN